ncbi:hypothetical protein WEI85_21115 [Actinomycetes bacterium KLBMP 9797]
MTVDERVRRILGEMVEDLTPAPDPYDRVRARYRRRQRRRMAAAGAGLTALMLVGSVVVLGPGGDSPPATTVDENRDWENVLAWSERAVQSPPRGAVAKDGAYVTALTGQLLDRQRRAEYPKNEKMSAVKVLFVDDVGPYRLALAAFSRTTHAPDFWPHAPMWFIGRKGASPTELADPTNVSGGSDGVEPYMYTSLENQAIANQQVHIAIAPDGCQFETAAWPQVTDWRAEPTGSYLVRTQQTVRPEWWQVTCDGVLRERLPSPIMRSPEELSAADVDEALSRARGKRDPEKATGVLRFAKQSWGYAITERPSVVWSGRLDGTTPVEGLSYDGAATVVAAPAVGGDGWLGDVSITYPQPGPNGAIGSNTPFFSYADPSDPSAVVVIPLGEPGPTLVITPEAATSVRTVRDDQVLERVPVKDAGAVLTAPVEAGVEVEALDASGTVLGRTGKPATAQAEPSGVTSAWHED